MGSQDAKSAALQSKAIGFLLLRYLISSWMTRRTRASAAVGVFLPILGVGVGVCCFTVILSVMGGFVESLKSRLLGLESHIEIVVNEGFGHVQAQQSTLTFIRGLSPEIIDVSPFQKGDAIIQSQNRPATVTLLGVEPSSAKKTTSYDKFLQFEHNLEVLNSDQVALAMVPEAKFPPIILGRELANMMGVDVGDRVTLLSLTPEEGPGGLAPRQFPMVIADVLSTGSPVHDNKLAIVGLKHAQLFYDRDGEWAGLQVKVKNPIDVDKIIPDMNVKLKELGLRAKPWTEANKALLRALKLERLGMSFVLYMVILVGCFSITITLVLAVKRKSREMAILRAQGFQRNSLGILYLTQGLLIGILGVAWGLCLGLLLLLVVQHAPLPLLTSAFNGKPLPVLINWIDILYVCVGSILLAGIAAVWPALEVMRIDVVQTLSDRNE